MAATPVTIVTGFLGSGKTTLILNLIPQLPKDYRVALLKNEFGDVAIDSRLAASAAISGVTELLGGCICCNLVGQLSDALQTLRNEQNPDRIVIETSGSAFPATLAMEVNRLARESGGHFVLDGVLSVVDVENWKGYEDTSVTARLQAQYTDLVVFNKWEDAGERRFDECLDRLGDLEIQTPWVKSDKGLVDQDLIFGIDGALAKNLLSEPAHDHDHSHSSEVEVLKVTIPAVSDRSTVDLNKLDQLLRNAPKDEVYRMKAILHASSQPKSSSGELARQTPGAHKQYILNWAFGRWTFTCVATPESDTTASPTDALRMTMILARYESSKWKKKLEQDHFLSLEGGVNADIRVDKIS